MLNVNLIHIFHVENNINTITLENTTTATNDQKYGI